MAFEIHNEKIYTLDDICEMFKVKPSTVKRWINKGGLNAKRVNNVYLISGSALREYLQS